ncbi:MAG: sulfite exporter TauE/SafE family protein [Betaproteobacteria bacterium]|nr:sulfite exporter TauE/SafE family protein [Betaproteobacteria bacterium]
MPEGYAAVVALAPIAFLGALVYGITGFGAALVAIPLATHFVPLRFALAVFVLLDLGNALRLGLEAPRNVVRGEVARLVPALLAGTVLGVTLLVNLPRGDAMLALGAFVVAYALYALLARGPRRKLRQGWSYVAGLAGGVTSTLFGAGGPPYAIYLSQRGLSKEAFRATLALTSVASISSRLFAFALTGLMSHAMVWIAAAIALPAAWLGISIASHLFVRIRRETLMRAVALMLLASGGSLLARALA